MEEDSYRSANPTSCEANPCRGCSACRPPTQRAQGDQRTQRAQGNQGIIARLAFGSYLFQHFSFFLENIG